jgi:hypothetical protein
MIRRNPLPVLIAASGAAFLALSFGHAAKADEAALNAYVASFEAADPKACEATFATGARFIDLGNDFSDRITWFCGAVVEGNGRYTVSNIVTEGATTRFDLEFRAGGYFLDGKGVLTGTDGKITDLVIERK